MKVVVVAGLVMRYCLVSSSPKVLLCVHELLGFLALYSEPWIAAEGLWEDCLQGSLVNVVAKPDHVDDDVIWVGIIGVYDPILTKTSFIESTQIAA